jgi:hypothetical protein
MESIRKPTALEKKLIAFLIKKSSILVPRNWDEKLLVQPMNDGGMGSLKLFPNEEFSVERKFGSQVSDHTFRDKDGVDVIVSLYIDTTGNLFELDLWKTDFSPLIQIPEI